MTSKKRSVDDLDETAFDADDPKWIDDIEGFEEAVSRQIDKRFCQITTNKYDSFGKYVQAIPLNHTSDMWKMYYEYEATELKGRGIDVTKATCMADGNEDDEDDEDNEDDEDDEDNEDDEEEEEQEEEEQEDEGDQSVCGDVGRGESEDESEESDESEEESEDEEEESDEDSEDGEEGEEE